ncbi:hypothetical protein GGX14DRAFT_388008 [Mycena pura]|uniref:Uncharacterized protein n=1 Tax=Mycena pura TaxID=153505 RepID=A0AAD6VTA6_9AGAR|nr:hypothetical protein GGX14DRAFT_388008 [Mycena pura]
MEGSVCHGNRGSGTAIKQYEAVVQQKGSEKAVRGLWNSRGAVQNHGNSLFGRYKQLGYKRSPRPAGAQAIYLIGKCQGGGGVGYLARDGEEKDFLKHGVTRYHANHDSSLARSEYQKFRLGHLSLLVHLGHLERRCTQPDRHEEIRENNGMFISHAQQTKDFQDVFGKTKMSSKELRHVWHYQRHVRHMCSFTDVAGSEKEGQVIEVKKTVDDH